MKYIHFFIFSLFLSLKVANPPVEYLLHPDNSLKRFDVISQKGSLKNNAVIDIRRMDESLYFFGTGNGLSFGESQMDGSIEFGFFTNKEMPRGGNPALAVFENSIAVSGVIDTIVATGSEPMGTGIALSLDGGESWNYLPQPVDPDTAYFPHLDLTQCGEMEYMWNTETGCFSNTHWNIDWGGEEVSSLLASAEVNNVSYDLSLNADYLYAASWAGGIRRYALEQTEPGGGWQNIPLPLDDDLNLLCGVIDSSYFLNPRDPVDNGNHNHKGFSVYTIADTVWAGTAAGINKGIINGECIDWVGHYTSWMQNISGNWVIGFTHQEFTDKTRLWAITWAADSQGEFHGLSYTDDGGESWHTTMPSGSSEKVYNLYGDSSGIWAAAESGLYYSIDGIHWEKHLRPVDDTSGEELLSESAMTVYHNQLSDELWMGNGDGLAKSNDNGSSWTVYRFWEKNNANSEEEFLSVYPNPFFINDYNQVNGDGFVRFVFPNASQKSNRIDIFDFAMDRVTQVQGNTLLIGSESEILWNGRNEFGDKAVNGVYFCRLTLGQTTYWTKLIIIN
ncbi:MAG: hypothetical protein QGF57_00670 [Candidatus Marinimicrobia bacterium]|nr:hypothetical protein [Candidatus Neomarinimicrobiota bacterium]